MPMNVPRLESQNRVRRRARARAAATAAIIGATLLGPMGPACLAPVPADFGTSLLVTVEPGSSPPVTQMRFEGWEEQGDTVFGPDTRPPNAGDPLEGAQTVRVVLRDDLDGRSVIVGVDGLARGEPVSYGVATALVSVGVETPVAVTLAACWGDGGTGGCMPETCASLRKNCGWVSDGRGRLMWCGRCRLPETCGGGGEENVCGCRPELSEAFCRREGKNCGLLSGMDNCGDDRTAMCGVCSFPQSCGGGGTPKVCGCTSESDDEFCRRLGRNCGEVTAPDNCGVTRRASSCGVCVGTGQTCGGGGVVGRCGCTPESNSDFCTRMNKGCGMVNGSDNCGASRTANCGSCNPPNTCGGGPNPDQCGCSEGPPPVFCARLGKNCGTYTGLDKCSVLQTVDCGTCPDGGVCGPDGGVPNVCGTCLRENPTVFCQRLGKDCDPVTAPDNCGVGRTYNCGTCSLPKTCGGGGVPNVCGCTNESDAEFCKRLEKNCDYVTGTDNCGASRIAFCGTCTYPRTCGGGGTDSVCGCTPETDAAFCRRYGAACGYLSRTDNCGALRTVADCGPCALPETCGGGGVPGQCGCTPEPDDEFCGRYAAACDKIAGFDNCSFARTAWCGSCSFGQDCCCGQCVNSWCGVCCQIACQGVDGGGFDAGGHSDAGGAADGGTGKNDSGWFDCCLPDAGSS